MTEITMTAQQARDAERSLVRLATCAERAGKLETLKVLMELGVRLDLERNVQEIMGRQI